MTTRKTAIEKPLDRWAKIAKIGGFLLGAMAFVGALFAAYHGLQSKAEAAAQHDEIRAESQQADNELKLYLKDLAERTETTREMIHELGVTIREVDTKLEERTERRR